MKMKHLVLVLATSWLISISLAQPQSQRTKYNFNSDWKVVLGDPENAQQPDFDDSAWKDITTPYAWNEDDAFRLDNTNLSTGISWYRKHFKVPDTAKDKKIFIEFEGIRQGGEFYLNGEWIGRNENGVMAFGFDISNATIQGTSNVLAARIDNSYVYREVATNSKFQWNYDAFYANYGGINKNVYLHVTDKLYQTLPLFSNLQTTGVYVYAQNIDIASKSALITAEAQVRNEYAASKKFRYQVVVENLEKKIIKTMNGQEYTLAANETRTITASDTVTNLEFWSWGYGYLYNVYTTLLVDDQPVDVVTTRTGFRKTNFQHGMFKLNDRTLHLKGYAQRSTNEWVALGSAVPAWMSDFSNQLVLESHGNLIRWMHVTPWKQDIESLDRLGVLQAMPAGDAEGDVTGRRWEQRLEVMRDAIIYNRNNPSVIFYESGNHGISEEHMTQMREIRDTFDPHGGRASGSREMLNSTVAEYGGEMLYINKCARIPLWQMEYSRDEGLRKYWDEFSPPFHKDGDGPPLSDGGDASSYNRNQDSHAIENVVRWFEYYDARPGMGERVNAGGVNIIFSDSNTHHRGAENYRRSGEVDALRLPKDAWYAHQVMWNTWVDVEVPATHIIGHWNYTAGTVKNVSVVSTADRVELKVNGQSVGWGAQSSRFLYTFPNVTYQAGQLEAVGYDANNKATTSDSRSMSGDPAAIRLSPIVSPAGLRASGADIAMVEVEVVDAQGKRCPISLDTIHFTLTGEATWRGGLAQGPDNYVLATSLPVENGVNRVLLRSTTKAGDIHLKAEADGLASASVTLTSKAFDSKDGLSTAMPSDGLSSNLSRGPTPQGESYTMKRRTLSVVSATAGSNPDAVKDSYDDDEKTGWSSNSTGSSAWVKYQLKSAANVNQVVMKLGSFKSKSYSLKVSVDDSVVFTGKSALSLGYATLTFNATKGENVTVALNSSSGTLSIVEAEIYGPL